MKTKTELQKQLDKLQKEIDNFKEEKPKLEVGKWYKSNLGGVFNYQGIGDVSYGVDSTRWNNTWNIHNNSGNKYTPATDKEVETALISEAKKRGFKEGVKIIGLLLGDTHTLYECEKYEYKDGDLRYWGDDEYFIIFQDGKWVEIIEAKKPTIRGHTMKVENGLVVFGCVRVCISTVRELYKDLTKFNSNVNGSEIDSFIIDNERVELSELEEVIKYLEK